MTPLLAPLLLALAAASPAVTHPAQDSTIATLFARDSATRVALTAEALDFNFTDRGARRVRRSADSATATRGSTTARTQWFDGFDGASLARGITDGVVRGMHLRFPLDAVDEVRTDGDELTVCFRPASPDAARCAKGQRLVFTGTTPGDVRRFADALDAARPRKR